MLKFNFKIALRNLLKNKAFSLINIIGLALGLLSFIFISLWVQDEMSYDKFHINGDNIYRIWWNSDLPQTRTPHPMTFTLVEEFPEVDNAVSITPVWGAGLTQPDRTVKYGEIQFEEKGIYAADTNFFKMFSFSLIKGNKADALKDVGSIVITRSTAKKYFKDEDPLGKIITINFGFDAPFIVTGVMSDIPSNAHFHFDFLISYVTMKAFETGEFFEWSDFGHYNYLLLKPGTDIKELEKKMISWSGKYIDWPEEAINELKNGRIGFKLQPLNDIHLKSHLKWELEPNGDINNIYIFSVLAILILVIACINFINLTTAKSSIRQTEVGIKKTLGASTRSIQFQFLTEALFSALFAMIIAIILFELLVPFINSVVQKNLSINYSDPFIVIYLLSLFIICGLLAGLYPSFVLSTLSPLHIIKGNTSPGTHKSSFRKVMVIFQFSASILLIISTLIISKQINFLRNQKLGFNSDQTLVIPIKDTLMLKNFREVEFEFMSAGGVINVSAVSNIPGRRFNQNPIRWEAFENMENVSELKVDYNFFSTLGLEIIQGRDFSLDIPSDVENAYIINESAAKLFDWETPIGEKISWYDDEIIRRGEVIGVVKNFHFQSLHTTIEPIIIQLNPNDYNYFLAKISTNDIPQTIAYLKESYEKRDPSHAFNYFFLNDDFNNLYITESQVQKTFGYFTMLAIIISCIGLFGLSSFSAERRRKEIGIRKVNGATSFNIIGMLSFEFLKWVIIAFFIAAPIAWYLMDQWLQNFAFHTNGNVFIYLIAGLAALMISLLTVGLQAYKAASRNPVEVLKYE